MTKDLILWSNRVGPVHTHSVGVGEGMSRQPHLSFAEELIRTQDLAHHENSSEKEKWTRVEHVSLFKDLSDLKLKASDFMKSFSDWENKVQQLDTSSTQEKVIGMGDSNMQTEAVADLTPEVENKLSTEERADDIGFCDSQEAERDLQIQPIIDTEPVNIQSPSIQEVAETEALNWVNSHILELSNTYGVAFVGFEKETLALLMRIDERKVVLDKKCQEKMTTAPKSSGIGKNELKNLKSSLNEEECMLRTPEEKLICWEEISAIKEVCGGPWVACGDLNTIRSMGKRRGCNRITNVMTDFTRWIEEMELHDPHMSGGKFTWFRGVNHPSATRLDIFLFSMEWEECFKNIRQKLMPRILSDHCPVTLEYGDWEQKKIEL
ncbi:hypothetical protein FXO37_17500 [Capsicum annuum]|nr:hypothetical protein FXO37_17500 [Capsicum annuum]